VDNLALVVDDEPGVRAIACRYLKEAGLICLPASCGVELMSMLDDGYVPDLVLLDIHLPDVIGTTLACQVHLRYPDIPVLLMSAWPATELTENELGDIRWRYLQKPFKQDALSQAAWDLLAR
jgi:two-component system nitrogen regulation response regulator GlnG